MAHQVNAGSSILTWVRATLVDLPLAVLSFVPWQTLTWGNGAGECMDHSNILKSMF